MCVAWMGNSGSEAQLSQPVQACPPYLPSLLPIPKLSAKPELGVLTLHCGFFVSYGSCCCGPWASQHPYRLLPRALGGGCRAAS